jgi:MoaA/NifB/PqqE/SkfB family radical SAM enzyme
LKKLISHGITHFQISFNQSDDEKYEYLIGIKKPLKLILKGIDNLNSLKMPININIVVNRHNYKEIKNIIEILIDKNIRNILISSLNPIGSNKNEKNIPISSINYEEIIPYIESALDVMIKKEMNIQLKDFPICVFSEKWRKEEYFVISGLVTNDLAFEKITTCQRCKFRNCLGIRKSYLEIYGDKEFLKQ